MSRAGVVLARGFEEIEAVTAIDVLRRAEVEVLTVGLTSGPIEGSHGIAIVVDRTIDEVAGEPLDAIVLPGGMPGAATLRDDERVQRLVARAAAEGRLVAAICAAPIALAAAGVLRGRRATCYPGFELPGATRTDERVVVDGRIVTSRGPGTALDFALALVRELVGSAEELRLRAAMLAG